LNFSNFHTHTHFSDGSDAPEIYIEEAIKQGITALGFSDHSPLPFENTFALRAERIQEYCDTIHSLIHSFTYSLNGNSQQPSGFQLFLGMEVDFIPGSGYPFSQFSENYPLDYLIGSVHLVRNGSPDDLWFIDGPDPATYFDGLNQLFGNDIRKGVTAYYRQINEMLESNKFDIIGHFDKIKMHNRGKLFREDEPWYIALVDESLELIKKHQVIVEVNTRGIYKKRSDSLFPGPWILKKVHELGIPVVISSDAHKPAEVAMLFGETVNLLRETGFRTLMNLTEDGWVQVPLPVNTVS
jgi:histidinol-phosphatase (PHP family)